MTGVIGAFLIVGCDRGSHTPPTDLTADPAVISAEAAARAFLKQRGFSDVEALKLGVGPGEYYFLFSPGGERGTVRIDKADGRASLSSGFPW